MSENSNQSGDSQKPKGSSISLDKTNRPSINDIGRPNTGSSNRSSASSSSSASPTTSAEDKAREAKIREMYNGFSAMELKREVNRLRSNPNARTDVKTLQRMVVLMDVMKERGVPLPGAGGSSSASQSRHSHAQEESSPSVVSILLTIVGVIFLLIKIATAFA